MQKLILIAAIVVAFVAGGVFVALTSDHVDVAAQDATPEATSEPAHAVEEVVAEGKVVPVRYAALSLPSGGIVSEVLVSEGDPVEAGQVIVRLNNGRQLAAVGQAEAEFARAEAQLAQAVAGPRAQEIQSARAAVLAAQAQATSIRQRVKPENVAAARARVAAAESALRDLLAGKDQDEKTVAKAALKAAEVALQKAQAEYDPVAYRDDIGALPQAAALQDATIDHERALAEYNMAVKNAKDKDVTAARSELAAAQAALADVYQGATQADIDAAEAEVQRAKAELALLEAGERPEAVAAAQAQADAARAALQQARASLADSELRAPFKGRLAALNVKIGEQVLLEQVAAQLADTSHWQVETTDLTELGIVNVQEGSPTTITVDAIPDLELTGRVVRIKPLGENVQGDIVYTVLVEPDQQDPRLRWNMTTAVTIRP